MDVLQITSVWVKFSSYLLQYQHFCKSSSLHAMYHWQKSFVIFVIRFLAWIKESREKTISVTVRVNFHTLLSVSEFLLPHSNVFWNVKSSGEFSFIKIWDWFCFYILYTDRLLGHRNAQRQSELPVGCGIWCWTGRVSRSDHWWWVLVPDWSL